MKPKHLFKLGRLMASAVFIAGGACLGGGCAATAPSNSVAKEISLPATRSPERTVTVWVPEAKGVGDDTKGTNEVAKVIELHAPNSPVQSVTVWVPGVQAKP